jgi:hypothetical protein
MKNILKFVLRGSKFKKETMGYNKKCSIEMRFFISFFINSKRGNGEPQLPSTGDPPRETGDAFSI